MAPTDPGIAAGHFLTKLATRRAECPIVWILLRAADRLCIASARGQRLFVLQKHPADDSRLKATGGPRSTARKMPMNYRTLSAREG